MIDPDRIEHDREMVMLRWAGRRVLERQLLAVTLFSLACGGRSTKSEDASAAAGTGAVPGVGAGPSTGGSLTNPSGGGGPSNGGTSVASGGASSSAGCPAVAGGSGGSGGYDFVECEAGRRTTVTGVVRDPAGRVPVYDAMVYILSGTLSHLPEGASCEVCAEVPALTTTVSDATGRFELEAPAGFNVPLVMQIGKWRRKIILPRVKACTETPILDAELTRLPRRSSEGTMPRMAVTSGEADSMPCFLRRLGIADEEFTTPDAAGHVHVYADCNAGPGTNGFATSLGGADFPPVGALNEYALQQYDALLFGCDDGACSGQIPQYAENIQGYTDQGGRVFLQHSQSAWLQSGPNAWRGLLVPQQTPQRAPDPLLAHVDVNFPKGFELANWLVATGASSQHGELALHGAALQYSAAASPAKRWLYADASSTPSVADSILALTLPTPISAPAHEQCGRVTFTDFHVANPAQPDNATQRFPDGCAPGDLSPQEKLLEFLLFDHPTCVVFNTLKLPRPPNAPCK